MAGLSKNEVKHVAKLSNLKLTEEEIEVYGKQLSSVIEYINELQEVKTEDLESTTNTNELENVYRNDEINPTRIFTQDESTSQAIDTHNGYFKVPAVIEKQNDDR